jgi:hypothetical protein
VTFDLDRACSGEKALAKATVFAVSAAEPEMEDWTSNGHCAGRSRLVIGGQAPACETLVTRNP